jgi:hypothetical protein
VLSVRSVIFGLALGAQSALVGAMIVFLAVVAHKGAAGIALGAGTFLYIAALDIIKAEFDGPRYHAPKWLAAPAGLGIMALLAIWISAVLAGVTPHRARQGSPRVQSAMPRESDTAPAGCSACSLAARPSPKHERVRGSWFRSRAFVAEPCG